MDRYRWNILGLCEMRWKNFGETTTEEGHEIFFSGKEDKHEHGVGFLVHKDIVSSSIGCRPVSSRLILIHLRAVPFSITVGQAYVPKSDDDDDEVEEFYDQLRMSFIRHRRRLFLLCKETGMQKWARMHMKTGTGLADPATMTRQMREDSYSSSLPHDLVLANTFGHHKASRRQTWHSTIGQHHNHIDYMLVMRSFQSGVNII